MKLFTYRLSNGIRLVHQQTDSPVAHCGLMVLTGSRNEAQHQHGLTHLVEHLLFKGTQKRKAYHVLSRMEDVGGELNAYTTKEETCVYTTFYNDYYDRAFELLADVMFHSVFPEREIQKEKEVIVDEINSYKDSPIELIFDEFEELILPNSSLGHSILGDEDKLMAFTRNDVIGYIDGNYSTDQMVLSSVGRLDFKKVVKYFEKYFSGIAARPLNGSFENYQAAQYQIAERRVQKDTHQAHCMLGTVGYGSNEDKRLVLHLINNMLGGPGLNSRLNLSLREKRGFAYNIESNYTIYSDMGIMSIYFGTDPNDIDKCIRVIYRELNKLATQAMGTSQLSRAKKQIIGQMAISAESHENLMLSNGKSILVYDTIEPLEQIHQKILDISNSDILEVSNELLAPERISRLIYY